MGAEGNQVKLRGVCAWGGGGGDGRVVTPPLHGASTRYSPVIDLGGRRWRRGTGEICAVITTGAEVGGLSGRQVPGKGEQIGEAQGTLHVLALEVEGEYPTGGTGTTTTMQLLWDAHAFEATV